MVFQDRTYTRAEYEALLTRHPHRRFERIHGEIVEKMPTELHAYVVMMLGHFLLLYLQQNPLGYVLPEARYSPPGDETNDRIPDLAFRSAAKGELVAEGSAPFMPDLAVEVQSPGQSDRLMSDKAQYYLAHGVRMVWLIYPKRRLVEVLTPEERHWLTTGARLDGGEVLPGFSVTIDELFPA